MIELIFATCFFLFCILVLLDQIAKSQKDMKEIDTYVNSMKDKDQKEEDDYIFVDDEKEESDGILLAENEEELEESVMM